MNTRALARDFLFSTIPWLAIVIYTTRPPSRSSRQSRLFLFRFLYLFAFGAWYKLFCQRLRALCFLLTYVWNSRVKLTANSSCLRLIKNVTWFKCLPYTEKSRRFYDFGGIKEVIWSPHLEVPNLVKVQLQIMSLWLFVSYQVTFFLQTAKRNIVNTKIEAKVDICTGEVSINQFTLFSVHCPLRLDWYPFDTQVVKNKWFL